MPSNVSVQRRSTSSLQNSLRRRRELPHAKFSVCHFSSWTAISCGDPRPARIGITPGIGLSPRHLDVVEHLVADLDNSAGRAMLTSLVPRTAIALRRLSPMTAPIPPRLALDLPCSIDAKNTRFSPARPMEATWALGSSSSWRIASAVSSEPFPLRWDASRISTLSLLIHR